MPPNTKGRKDFNDQAKIVGLQAIFFSTSKLLKNKNKRILEKMNDQNE